MGLLHVILPEVSAPSTTNNMRGEELLLRRIVFSFLCLLIYLTLSSIPVYGAFEMYSGHDPLYAQRLILSANRGSLLELGVSPIITAGMFLQVLESAGIVKHGDNSKEYRQKSTRVAALLLSFLQAVLIVSSGVYGSMKVLGYGNAILIVLQLFIASWIVLLMDEAMIKGHGLGSGVTLFMCAHICTDVIWRSFCPFMLTNGKESNFVGIFVAIPHILFTRRSVFKALYEIFFREGLSNLFGLVSMVLVSTITLYVDTLSVDLPLKVVKGGGGRGAVDCGALDRYSIPLLYTSSMPVMLYFTAVGNFLFISQVLFMSYPRHAFIKMIGSWEQGRGNGQLVPTSGIAYLISSPNSITAVLSDPFQFIFYICFVLAACSMLSQMYVELSGTDAKTIAQQLVQKGLSLRGHRESNLYKSLNRYIPTAASLGGIIIGAISLFADFTGCMVSGSGILIVTSSIYSYTQSLKSEKHLGKLGLKDILKNLVVFLPFGPNGGDNKQKT